MITTTSYGTWLPGDARGYVQKGRILPSNPRLLHHAQSLLTRQPVIFTDTQQLTLFHALRLAADEFGYRLTDVSIENWHLHWIVGHGSDPIATVVGRCKTRMRQSLNRGRIWSEGYHYRTLTTDDDTTTARRYIANHAGCRLTDSQPRHPTPHPPAKPGANV